MDDGWPLGLQLLNARNLELQLTRSSSLISSLFTSNSSSTSFSSQSTKTPYFHHQRRRGVTLRSLLNTPSVSSTPPRHRPEIGGLKKSHVTHNKRKSWLHSLCSEPASHDSNADVDAKSATRASHLSLGYLLQQERVMSIRRAL